MGRSDWVRVGAGTAVRPSGRNVEATARPQRARELCDWLPEANWADGSSSSRPALGGSPGGLTIAPATRRPLQPPSRPPMTPMLLPTPPRIPWTPRGLSSPHQPFTCHWRPLRPKVSGLAQSDMQLERKIRLTGSDATPSLPHLRATSAWLNSLCSLAAAPHRQAQWLLVRGRSCCSTYIRYKGSRLVLDLLFVSRP